MAKERILDSLWAFNSSFIVSHSKLSESAITAIKGDRCEDANDDVLSIIDDIDRFIEDAIGCDGRGHFINNYDGNELEIEIDGEDFFAYHE